MTQTTFQLAVNTAYANNKGDLRPASPNQAASNGSMLYVGNTQLNFDDNYLYLNTTQGSGTVTSTNSTVAAAGYTVLPNGLQMAYGQVNANSSALIVKFANPFTANVYGLSLAVNAAATLVNYTTLNSTAFTVVSNVTANAVVSYIAVGQ